MSTQHNGVMIDVIGTDAGAPGSLPPGAQLLVEQAHLLAAPKRMLPALQQWRTSEPNQRCITSDHPIALSEELLALGSDQRAVVCWPAVIRCGSGSAGS